MTDAWALSLFDEEPTVYGPPPLDPSGRLRYPDRMKPSERDGRYVHKVTGSRGDDGKPKAAPPHPLGSPPLDWWIIDD